MADQSNEHQAQDRTLELAAGILGGPLEQVEFLGGSGRSIVCRGRPNGGEPSSGRPDDHGPDDHGPNDHGPNGDGIVPDGASVVVKRFVADPVPSEFHRERVGLEILAHSPSLLASDPEHGLLVMTDLGDWPTLADLLLGDDPTAAAEAAQGWARALGEVVGASRPIAGAVTDRLRQHDTDFDRASRVVGDGLERLLGLTGRESTAQLRAELATITPLTRSGPDDLVWPGDTCPDNAVLTSEGWRFLDLEGTSVHHPAMVAAYTVLPFATCWCVFDPPAGFTDDLFAAFTEALGRHVPDVVAEPTWSERTRAACAAWILAMTGLVLDSALEHNNRVGPADRPSPTRRQLLTTRWRWAAENLSSVAPAIADLCAAGAAWAERTWSSDTAPIGPYPAFADAATGATEATGAAGATEATGAAGATGAPGMADTARSE